MSVVAKELATLEAERNALYDRDDLVGDDLDEALAPIEAEIAALEKQLATINEQGAGREYVPPPVPRPAPPRLPVPDAPAVVVPGDLAATGLQSAAKGYSVARARYDNADQKLHELGRAIREAEHRRDDLDDAHTAALGRDLIGEGDPAELARLRSYLDAAVAEVTEAEKRHAAVAAMLPDIRQSAVMAERRYRAARINAVGSLADDRIKAVREAWRTCLTVHRDHLQLLASGSLPRTFAPLEPEAAGHFDTSATMLGGLIRDTCAALGLHNNFALNGDGFQKKLTDQELLDQLGTKES